MSQSFSEKTPPPFNAQSDDFAKWKKKFKVWQGVTDVDKKRQGGLVALRLDDNTQDSIFELMTIEEIKADGGIDALLNHLDTMFQKDPSFTAYEVYEDFEMYRRPPDLPVTRYLIEFHKRLLKLQGNKTSISDDILAYKLLKSANLTQSEEQLIILTVGEMKYNSVVNQLRKAFIGSSSSNISRLSINVEHREVKSDTLYGFNFERIESESDQFLLQSSERNPVANNLRAKNLLDGNIRKCWFCDSIYHSEMFCPDKIVLEPDTFRDYCGEKSGCDNDSCTLLHDRTHLNSHQESYVDLPKLVNRSYGQKHVHTKITKVSQFQDADYSKNETRTSDSAANVEFEEDYTTLHNQPNKSANLFKGKILESVSEGLINDQSCSAELQEPAVKVDSSAQEDNPPIRSHEHSSIDKIVDPAPMLLTSEELIVSHQNISEEKVIQQWKRTKFKFRFKNQSSRKREKRMRTKKLEILYEGDKTKRRSGEIEEVWKSRLKKLDHSSSTSKIKQSRSEESKEVWKRRKKKKLAQSTVNQNRSDKTKEIWRGRRERGSNWGYNYSIVSYTFMLRFLIVLLFHSFVLLTQ